MKDGECSVAWSRLSSLNTATLGSHEKAIWEATFASSFIDQLALIRTQSIANGGGKLYQDLLSLYRRPATAMAIIAADAAIIALRELEGV